MDGCFCVDFQTVLCICLIALAHMDGCFCVDFQTTVEFCVIQAIDVKKNV